MNAAPLPVAVLISGRGSNMEAIARAGLEGRMPARVTVVVSDQPGAAGLDTARALGIRTEILEPRPGDDRAAYGAALSGVLARHAPGLVALAGFMRILDAALVRAWAGRMLNIHPSLLPRYPGLHTHRRVLEVGDRVHGCTVHFVTEEVDAGPRILQARVPVEPGDDVQSLAARVQRWEHVVYPEAIGWIGAGRLALREGAAWLDGRRLDEPVARGEA